MSEETKKILPVAPAEPQQPQQNVPRTGKVENIPNDKPAAPDPSPFKLGPA